MTPDLLDPDAVPEWLASLWPPANRDSRIVAGVNDDDCAVIQWSDAFLVATTDFLNSRPIVVQLNLGGLREIGRLLVASNLADLCGSGAEPRALLVAATFERNTSMTEFRDFMFGIRDEAAKWGVPVVGGDTKLGQSRALLAVALGGINNGESLFLKNRAQSGDLLWSSGALGSCNAAAVGLTQASLSDEWKQWAKDAILVPRVPLAKSRALARAQLGHGGIDVSDGLGADLRRMCVASRVGVIVEASQIPIEPQVNDVAQAVGLEPWSLSFGCGGDFQFLVTTSESSRSVMEGLGFSLIGRMTKEQELRLRRLDGVTVRMPDGGHRDARNVSFVEEILLLAKDAENAPEV